MTRIRALMFALVWMVAGCGSGADDSGADAELVATLGREYKNASPNITNFYPARWVRSTEALSKLAPSDFVDFIRFIHNFPTTPQNAFSSDETHDPVSVYLFYGMNVCDDSARVAHRILRQLGKTSRIVYLDGHVANELLADKWVYFDTYKGTFIHNNGVFLNTADLISQPIDYNFQSTNVITNITSTYNRSEVTFELYNLIVGNISYGTESVLPNTVPDYVLLPGDSLEIKQGIDFPFNNYHIVENPSEGLLAREWYWQMTLIRNLTGTNIGNQLANNLIDTYNDIKLDSKTFVYKGVGSSFTSHFKSASPLLGIIVTYESLVCSDGTMVVNVMDEDTKQLLNASYVDIKDKNSVSIPFNTLRPSYSDRAIRNIGVTIAFIGGSALSTARLTKPVIRVVSQITPKAAETF